MQSLGLLLQHCLEAKNSFFGEYSNNPPRLFFHFSINLIGLSSAMKISKK